MTVPSVTRPATSTPNSTQRPAAPSKPAYLRKEKGDGGSPRTPGRPGTPTPGAMSSKNVQHPYTPTRRELSDIFYKIFSPKLQNQEEVTRLQTASEIEVKKWLNEHFGEKPSIDPSNSQEVVDNQECQQLRQTVADLQERCAANQAALEAAQSEVSSKTEEIRTIEDQMAALKSTLDESQNKSADLAGALSQLDAMSSELAKKIAELSELDEKFKQLKISVLELSAEVGKLMPHEGVATAQVTPEFIHQTILNCISQVNELKRGLGLEVEEVLAQSSQELLLKPEAEFLGILNKFQSQVELENSEFKTTLESITVSKHGDHSNDVSSACRNQTPVLLQSANEARKLREVLIRIITDLQAEIEDGKTPNFTPEFLEGIQTITGWYSRQQQENDIAKHIQGQQRKIDDLSLILTRWNKIDEILNSQLFTIELNISNEMTEEILRDLFKIKEAISGLRIPEETITEESIRDKLLLVEYDRFSKEIRSFQTYLRDCRKSFSEMNVPTDKHLKDTFLQNRQKWYDYQKRTLKEHEDRFKLLTPKINRLIEKLHKEVEVGKFDEKVPPIYLERLAICTGQTVDKIVEENIKPFEQAHLQRETMLRDLIAKQQKILEAAGLAKKEVNRAFDALQNGAVYRYETTYNLRGSVDPEVEKLFPNTNGVLLPSESPQIPRSPAASSSKS